MDRIKVMNAILEEYRKHGQRDQEDILKDALKHMPDGSLLLLASDLGVIFTEEARS